MAFKSLDQFKGSFCIYIGEEHGGCTTTDEFFNLVEKQWTVIEKIHIPYFP